MHNKIMSINPARPTSLHVPWALLPEGWRADVRLAIGANGRIESVSAEQAPAPDDRRLADRLLLPAPGNLHSHAFQRAMAGLTETRSRENDDFWSWRQAMYRFTGALEPEQVEAIAALVQVEMLEAGYAAVGEFHYLHHDRGGAPYAAPAETSRRIFAAAAASGIGLTHLPVFYTCGGAGGAPIAAHQKRFANDLAGFERLLSDAAAGMGGLPADCVLGVAPHSLRAVRPEHLAPLSALRPDAPVHIHIAEQVREVAEIEAWLGARPVAWLLDHAAVDARWCLVHATHMDMQECRAFAASGAVAGLCPITEANLGDGIFDAPAFLEAGGRFGIGSDSNVRVALAEELRLLEYGQRLARRQRAVLSADSPSVGESLYRRILAGGARALGRDSGALAAGNWADMLSLDAGALAFAGIAPAHRLDAWIFAADDRLVREVWSAGRLCVEDGRHRARPEIEARYRAAMRDLAAAL